MIRRLQQQCREQDICVTNLERVNIWAVGQYLASARAVMKEASHVHTLIAVKNRGDKQEQQLTQGEQQAFRRRMVLSDSSTLLVLAATARSCWAVATAAAAQDLESSFRVTMTGIQNGFCRMCS